MSEPGRSRLLVCIARPEQAMSFPRWAVRVPGRRARVSTLGFPGPGQRVFHADGARKSNHLAGIYKSPGRRRKVRAHANLGGKQMETDFLGCTAYACRLNVSFQIVGSVTGLESSHPLPTFRVENAGQHCLRADFPFCLAGIKVAFFFSFTVS